MRAVAASSGGVLVLVLLGVTYSTLSSSKLARQVDELRREREQLLDYARRLSASRRVAQVNVLGQYTDELGRPVTHLLWQEIGPDGVLAIPENVVVVGTLVYFEAFVIKFDYQHVAEGDPERGTSLALFRRIFGDLQVPDEAPMLDRAGRLPAEALREPRQIEQQLWDRFWDFVEDPVLAAQYGVRVAQCEAPAVPLRPGQAWQVTLDAPGGLNLEKILDIADETRRRPSPPQGIP